MLASSRKPCGGGNPRGRIWNPPLRPTAKCRGQPGNRNLRVIINLCRGRCLHRPANLAAAQGPAGGPWPSPTNHGGRPANRCGLNHPGDRRAGCPHPAGPCGGGNVCGRDKSLPYKPRRAHGQPGNRNLRVIINLCRGRCSHRPANPAAAQTPTGGYGIRPYGQRQMLRPTGKPQILRRGEGGGVRLRNIGRWRDIFRGGGRGGGCGIRGCGNLSRLQNGPGLQPRPRL